MKTKPSILRSSLCGVALALLSQTATAAITTDVNVNNESNKPSLGKPRLIVKYKDNAPQSMSIATNASTQMTRRSGKKVKHIRKMATGAHVVQVEEALSESEMNTMMQSLQADSNVEYVHEDQMLQIMATPSDPQYNNQWHYYESAGGLNLPDAWDLATGDDVVVAVIDTGITNHADLSANLLPGYDMISNVFVANDGGGRDSNPSDPGDATSSNECGDGRGASSSSWHGTHVAGTVAAVSNNGVGIAGVAYDAKVVPIRALGKCGGLTSDIADAMIWAAGGSVPGVPNNPNPAQVLNLSLGGSGSCDPTSQAAINQAVALGATVVVAAGNSNVNVSNATPANCQNVVSVAAVGRTGGKAVYSNFGNLVDVAAPGGDQSTGRSDGVLSTLNAGQTSPAGDIYAYYQGTSMAAPHVAGVAALLYSVNSTITPAEVESILETTARSFPSTCNSCGTGIVDAAAAVQTQTDTKPNPDGGVLENGVAKSGLSGSLQSESFFTIEVPAGASNLRFNIAGGSGDADLYVRFGANPTTASFDCRPFIGGNVEECVIGNVSAGTYYVMIRGYSAYSGLSLIAQYDEGGSEPDSISESNISGTTNSFNNYQLDVPAGQSLLTVTIGGGSGDADLYVRFGANPTTAVYDCRPFRNGNSEVCTFNNPPAGTYFIRLRGYSAYSGVSLTAISE